MTRTSISRWAAGAALVAALALAAACGAKEGSRDSVRTGGTSGEAARSDSALAPASGAPQLSDKVGGANGAPSGNAGPDTAGGAALPSQLDRKIIRVATVSLTTDNVAAGFEDVANIALGAGGFVSSSSFGNNDDRQTASVTIRVPGTAYQDALARLRKLGEVKQEDSNTNDITEQYTDLSSRLRNLQETEKRYLDFLTRAENITDTLTIQDRINATRGEIEQVQGRIQLLDNQTDLATITVHLDPPAIARVEPKAEGARSPLEVAADSFDASLVVLLGLATVVLAVGAFSWWIVPLAIGGVVIARRQVRPTRERRADPGTGA